MTLIKNQQAEITILLKKEVLYANLFIPTHSKGIVLFAHGSGSSRFSRRNQQVATYLNHLNFTTLLLDLLTSEEELIDQQTREFRFNIPLLAQRLSDATTWTLQQPEFDLLKIAYFGASTGAAAALIAAANQANNVHAVVSRGGRPDLADAFLPKVLAPTLFIVGSLDTEVIQLNQQAQQKMIHAQNRELAIVEGATHLFEEPGTLDQVMVLAGNWFIQYLT